MTFMYSTSRLFLNVMATLEQSTNVRLGVSARQTGGNTHFFLLSVLTFGWMRCLRLWNGYTWKCASAEWKKHFSNLHEHSKQATSECLCLTFTGIKPPTLWLIDDLLCLLHSHPQVVIYVALKVIYLQILNHTHSQLILTVWSSSTVSLTGSSSSPVQIRVNHSRHFLWSWHRVIFLITHAVTIILPDSTTFISMVTELYASDYDYWTLCLTHIKH